SRRIERQGALEVGRRRTKLAGLARRERLDLGPHPLAVEPAMRVEQLERVGGGGVALDPEPARVVVRGRRGADLVGDHRLERAPPPGRAAAPAGRPRAPPPRWAGGRAAAGTPPAGGTWAPGGGARPPPARPPPQKTPRAPPRLPPPPPPSPPRPRRACSAAPP